MERWSGCLRQRQRLLNPQALGRDMRGDARAKPRESGVASDPGKGGFITDVGKRVRIEMDPQARPDGLLQSAKGSLVPPQQRPDGGSVEVEDGADGPGGAHPLDLGSGAGEQSVGLGSA